MSRDEAAQELRAIALKFFRGNPQDNREGFQAVGLLARLEDLVTLLASEPSHDDSGCFDVLGLYDRLADEISHGRGAYPIHLYFHRRPTAAPLLSARSQILISDAAPEGKGRLFLSTAPAEPESGSP